MKKFINFVEKEFNFNKEYPFNRLYLWLEQETCDECIEYIVSIMMEPFNEIVQPLIKEMSSDEEKYFNIPTDRTIGELQKILESKYSNILSIDFKNEKNYKNFGLYQKIKRSLDLRIVLRNKVQI